MKKIIKNNTSFNISDDPINDFFIKSYDNWEPFSFKIIDDLYDTGTTFIDIGSWICPILLYVASINDCHHNIDETIIKKWTNNIEPLKKIEIKSRIIYVFKF